MEGELGSEQVLSRERHLEAEVQSALTGLVANERLRSALLETAVRVKTKTEDGILGREHSWSHVARVIVLGAKIVEEGSEEAVNLKALQTNQTIKSLLASALLLHDLGAVPGPGQTQAEIYSNHELASAEQAARWMDENKELIESLLADSEITFETAKRMVQAMVLATNIGVDLFPPLSQKLRQGPAESLISKETDSPQQKEFKTAVKAVLAEHQADPDIFQAFVQALEVIGAADLGSYLEPVPDWLPRVAAMWAEFQQGWQGEDGQIHFRQPPAKDSSAWLVSGFIDQVIKTWGNWLPPECRQMGEEIVAFQKKLVGQAGREDWQPETALSEKLKLMAQIPDHVVRVEAALLPPLLVELAERFSLELWPESRENEEGISLGDQIVSLGDQILTATKPYKKELGWGPMASEIFQKMYSAVAPDQRTAFLQATFDLIVQKLTLPSDSNLCFQVAAGRFPEAFNFLTTLTQAVEGKNYRVALTWRADQDTLGFLEKMVASAQNPSLAIALGGKLSSESVRGFFETLIDQKYRGKLIVHAGYGEPESLGVVVEQMIQFLNQSESFQEPVVFHLDTNYSDFLVALNQNPQQQRAFLEAINRGELILSISPWNEFVRQADPSSFQQELRNLLDFCRKHKVSLQVATNNMTLAGGMGRLLQEAVVVAVGGKIDWHEKTKHH